MSLATLYDRAVGFFNSAIYIIAWPSLKDFVARSGRMRLICSPVLPAADIEAIETGYSERYSEENAEKLQAEIRYMLGTPFLYKPTTVLATLIALEVIDVRIAFMKKNSHHERLFHDKLGLFRDIAGSTVAFKGSMNETWAGLSADGNLESVDIFLSWEHSREAARVRDLQDYFDALWENRCEHEGVTVKVFPEIARSELVRASDLQRWPELVDEICREIEAAERFEAQQRTPSRKTLRPHQITAIQAWEQQGRRGILKHATGSGKTFTATCVIRDALIRREVPLVLVPSELLLEHWNTTLCEDLADIQPLILKCGAGHDKWRADGLIGPWTRAASERPRIVLATMQTAAMPDFLGSVSQGSHILLVADEVHRIGSPNHLRLLTLDTGPRLGLSATPERAGDDFGTAQIFDYFSGIVPPPFTLKDAIEAGTLTPYLYHVHTVTLTEDEQRQWDELTKRIRRVVAQHSAVEDRDQGSDSHLKMLLIERSRVLKQAARKASAASNILVANYQRGDRWIVYCDDLVQLRAVREELSRMGLESIEYHSAMAGDKAQTIRLFEANGGIVVSIRCLDEGVDIPSVTHGLILASSRNPREYVQRRGRVLRRAEGKSVAHVYDVIVLPATGEQSDQAEDPRLNIIISEMIRSLEFAKSAMNPAATTDIERIALRFATDYKTLLTAGYEDDV